jgi:homoserine O-acetyltransferase
MNASVESISPEWRPAPGFIVREGTLEVPGEFPLHYGGTLASVRIAWHLSGPAHAPVIAALGGLSAHRRVATDPSGEGWWSRIAAPGAPLDTAQFRILGFDFLGGSGGTTGPSAGEPFPAVSTFDQAQVLLRLLNHLGIKVLRAIAGGSYGGMVALAFAERFPERVSQLIVIGASDSAHPLSTGWRSAQRQIVRFALESGRGAEGLAIARALAMCTYRGREELAARFRGAPSLEKGELVAPIEQYLRARGRDYAARYRPESFVCLSESIDLHHVDASRILTPVMAVAIAEDQLVPLEDVRTMAARLPAGCLRVISSRYGHDAFLKEPEALRASFAEALEGCSC